MANNIEEIKKWVFPVEPTKKFNCIEATVYYFKDRKYYTMSVTPMKIEEKDGYTTRTFECFEGFKMIVRRVNRKSQAQTLEAIKTAKLYSPQLIEQVCAKHNLTLA